MPKRNTLRFALDIGNGTCKGISSERTDIVEFAPVIAPLTDRRGINRDDEKPDISLVHNNQTLVFGVDDVFEHGRRASIRRLNSVERYKSDDYFRLIEAMWLQLFAAQRGSSQYIKPSGIISLPISQYNTEATVKEVRSRLVGKHKIEDYEGCTLKIEIEEDSLYIIPESSGAMTHYAINPDTLRRRDGVDTGGDSLVVDSGYETTDVSLFEGMRYQRDQSFTIPRAGIGTIAREIQDYARQRVRDADVSRIDRALTMMKNRVPGQQKLIEVSPETWMDVTAVYDEQQAFLAHRIADEIQTRFAGDVVRVIYAGGGAYHLAATLDTLLPFNTLRCPEAENANVIGAATLLQLKDNR